MKTKNSYFWFSAFFVKWNVIGHFFKCNITEKYFFRDLGKTKTKWRQIVLTTIIIIIILNNMPEKKYCFGFHEKKRGGVDWLIDSLFWQAQSIFMMISGLFISVFSFLVLYCGDMVMYGWHPKWALHVVALVAPAQQLPVWRVKQPPVSHKNIIKRMVKICF